MFNCKKTMAEPSACLMRSFSEASSTSQDCQEVDPLRHALTTSVSFGRFMSESLAWEKWSSFTQNRYLEEVEKYAKPGSVAEKKAFFEAHYRRKPAQKTAASNEEQNAAVNDNGPASSLENLISNDSLIETELGQAGCYVAIEERQDEEDPTLDLNLSVDESSTNKCGQGPLEWYDIESDQFEGLEQGIEQPTFAEKPVECSSLLEHEQSPLEEWLESDQIEVTERGTEQPAFVENQVGSSILPEYGQSPQRKFRMENEEIDGTEQELEHPTSVQKQVESCSTVEDAECINAQQEAKASARVTTAMEVSAFSDKKKPASTSTKLLGHRQWSRLRPPLNPTTPIRPKYGDQATSCHKRTGMESVEKKRSTPKSLHMSINFGSRVGDTNKLSSPELQKIVNSRLVRNRTTRESPKKQSLTRASTNGISKNLPATPRPAIERTRKVQIHPISESVTGDRKSVSLYMRPKAQPIVSASFNLRTEERAAKRKEKLQQKLSMEAAEKEHLQARVKEKIRNDAKGVRQSIASQGKANSSLHLGIKPLDVQMQKIIRTQPCSPGIERKQDSEVLQNHSRPTWRHSVKADSFKCVLEKYQLPPTRSTKLFPRKKCMNENTSPNIQV